MTSCFPITSAFSIITNNMPRVSFAIIRLYTLFVFTAVQVMIVMELVKNGDLRKYLINLRPM